MSFTRIAQIPTDFDYSKSPDILTRKDYAEWVYREVSQKEIPNVLAAGQGTLCVITARVFPIGPYPHITVKFTNKYGLKDDMYGRHVYAAEYTADGFAALSKLQDEIQVEISRASAAMRKIHDAKEAAAFAKFYSKSKSQKPLAIKRSRKVSDDSEAFTEPPKHGRVVLSMPTVEEEEEESGDDFKF